MTDQQCANLRSLLQSTPLIAELRENHMPKLDGNTLEERAMAASERAGAEGIINAIVTLSQQAPTAAVSSPYIGNLADFENRPKAEPMLE